jgi:hypothetical protein
MKKMMKKAEMGMQAKSPKKKGKMISESGDLADALNETMRMRKAGTAPKTDKDAGNYMDKLSKKGKLGPKMKMGGPLKDVPADNAGLPKLSKDVRNKMGFKKNGGAMKKAMMGTGMHKMPDGSMMENSMMKKGGSVKKKMQYGGKAASMTPPTMMKKGGMMKKCKYGCK